MKAVRTILLELPEEIDKHLCLVSNNHQDFILEAIKEKLSKKELLNRSLIEGYKSTYKEDLDLTSDFESADLEDLK
jgi:hypothetical protein